MSSIGEPDRVEWHHVLPSTQDLAHRRAAAGAPAGTAIAARKQTRGRGTRGRVWDAGDGGLWLSVIGRPEAVPDLEVLSVRVGLALAEALELATGSPAGSLGLKWPNDLVARDRKLGGVLCEARWQGGAPAWVVVGVGINLANPLPADLAAPAIRGVDLGWPGEPAMLAPAVHQAVARALAASGPLGPAELAAFAARDWLRGRRLARPVAGRARGITPAGRLQIEVAGGQLVDVVEPVAWADMAASPDPG